MGMTDERYGQGGLSLLIKLLNFSVKAVNEYLHFLFAVGIAGGSNESCRRDFYVLFPTRRFFQFA
jgi:hypothetical protein